jgi:hypothetical protein
VRFSTQTLTARDFVQRSLKKIINKIIKMKNWITVASADHVSLGKAQGFMQVCHGKPAPLKRIQAGDRVVYYSPTQKMGSGPSLRAFTAFGIVQAGEVYQVEMYPNFHPFRRNVMWLETQLCSIYSLLEELEFSKNKSNWAYPLRFGLVEISAHDMEKIAAAMQALLTPTQAIQATLF